MALSKVNPNLITQGASGRKNLIINGAMNVAQRGTSSAGLGADATTYLLDRWAFGTGGTAGRLTMSQDSDGPAGFANSLKIDCTTADTSIAVGEQSYLIYKFEGQDLQQLKKGTSGAESMTLSFYVKGNAAATYTAEFFDADNNRHNGQTFSVTTSWNKVTLTYVPDTTGAYDDDNALSLYLFIWIHTGTTMTSGTFASNTWSASANNTRVSATNTSFFDSTARTLNITGVQLEVGSVATDFEHRTYAESLLACQRYFEVVADGSGADDSPYFGMGQGAKSDQINFQYYYKAEKRAPITMTVATVTNGYAAKTHSTTISHNTLGIGMTHQNLYMLWGYMTNITGVTEQSCWQMQLNGATALITVSAEL
jgi:hypothetical protein